MYTLGSGFIPSANHAGGLRYHGMSSIVSQLYDDKIRCRGFESPLRYFFVPYTLNLKIEQESSLLDFL